jgi:hypothetical protein
MRIRRNTSKVLYSSAFVLILSAWYVVLHDPVYRGVLARLLGAGTYVRSAPMPDVSMHEAKDPPLNAAFPSVGVGNEVLAKTARNSRGYLLAAIGDCQACTALDLRKLYSQAKERGITLIAIAYGDEDQIRQYGAQYRRDGVDVPVYFDDDRKLTTALNAYYGGRLYYYTADWKQRDMHIDNYLFRTGRFDRLMRGQS